MIIRKEVISSSTLEYLIPSGRNIGPISITVVRAKKGEEISNNPLNFNIRGQSHPSRKNYGKIICKLECQANDLKVRL